MNMKKILLLIICIAVLIPQTVMAQLFDVTIQSTALNSDVKYSNAKSMTISLANEAASLSITDSNNTVSTPMTLAGVRYNFTLAQLASISQDDITLPDGDFTVNAPMRRAAAKALGEPVLKGPAFVVMTTTGASSYYLSDYADGITVTMNSDGTFKVCGDDNITGVTAMYYDTKTVAQNSYKGGAAISYSGFEVAFSDAMAQTEDATIKLQEDVETNTIVIESSGCPAITLDLNDKILKTVQSYIIDAKRFSYLYVVDNSAVKTKKYFTVDEQGNCKLSDSETANFVEGGVLTGANTIAIHVYEGTLFEARNVNFIANGTSNDGGAIYLDETPGNIYNCKFFGNKATKGGAIYADQHAMIKDCVFKYNHASDTGGAIYSYYTVITLINTQVTDNSTKIDGGGIRMDSKDEEECLAAGTMITMADGSQKKIEEIQVGDVIRSFDHEAGAISSSPVFYVFKSPAPSTSFTLIFESGATLDIVGMHSLLCESSLKYERIAASTAAAYVGKRFYNAESASWDRLVDFKLNDTPTDFYSVLSTHHINCVANGMLNVSSECDYFLNIYELDSNLKADAGQLAEDIATYGLGEVSDYPQLEGYSQLFECFNGKYMKIAIGKGLVTSSYIWRVFGNLDFSQQADGAGNAPMMSRARKAASEDEPVFDTYVQGGDNAVIIVGENVIIKNNKNGVATNNLSLEELKPSSSSSDIEPAKVRFLEDHSGSEIGISVDFSVDEQVITKGSYANEADVSIFSSDDGDTRFFYENSQIVIKRHSFDGKTLADTPQDDGLYCYVCDFGCGKEIYDYRVIKDYAPNAEDEAKNLELTLDYLKDEGVIFYTSEAVALTDNNQFKDVNAKFKSTSEDAPTYTRTMTTQWGTLVLPFAVNAAGNHAGCELYETESVLDGNFIILTKCKGDENGVIAAGTPVFVRKTTEDASSDITIYGDSSYVHTNAPADVKIAEAFTMKGTYSKVVNPAGGYIIANDYLWSVDQLTAKNKTVTVNPFRAYLEAAGSNEAKLMLVVDGEDATAVGSIRDGQLVIDNEAAVYNLQGQKLRAPQRGVNIINGKKVIRH